MKLGYIVYKFDELHGEFYDLECHIVSLTLFSMELHNLGLNKFKLVCERY